MPVLIDATLEQLLSSCQEHKLIDGYERAGQWVVIVRGTLRQKMMEEQARLFLDGMLIHAASTRKVACVLEKVAERGSYR